MGKSNLVGRRCSFSALDINDVFNFGGAIWYKCSKRTARLTENNRVFYFKSGEVVTSTGLVLRKVGERLDLVDDPAIPAINVDTAE